MIHQKHRHAAKNINCAPWRMCFRVHTTWIDLCPAPERVTESVQFCVHYIYIYISADPGLCQGRGGAWDHRRCGTWLSGRKQRHTPSRQHLCQLHAPAIYMLLPNSYTYMPLPSVFQGVQDCRLPGLKPPQTLPQASKATTLTATCPCHLFFREFKPAV